jgi:hypothetical protein
MSTPVEAKQGLLIEVVTTCTSNPADTWKSQLWTFACLLEAVPLKHLRKWLRWRFSVLSVLEVYAINSMAIMESTASCRTVHRTDGPACYTHSR